MRAAIKALFLLFIRLTIVTFVPNVHNLMMLQRSDIVPCSLTYIYAMASIRKVLHSNLVNLG
jgi:hypothetical protein